MHAKALFAWIAAHKARVHRALLGVALLFFLGGLFFSLRSSPGILLRADPWPLLGLLLFTLPLGLVLNGLDFQVMAKICETRVGFLAAFRTCVLARAANMLPLPGNLTVRLGHLKAQGVSFRRSGSIAIVFAALFGGIGFLYSGLWSLTIGSLFFGTIFIIIGFITFFVIFFQTDRDLFPRRLLLHASVYRLGLCMVDAMAMMFALWAIGVSADYRQTAIFVTAGFLGSIVPGGIGIREGVVAVLSPIAGIDPSDGFIAATVSRFSGMAFLTLATLALMLIPKKYYST